MALRRYGFLAAAFLSVAPVVCHAAGASSLTACPGALVFEENRGQAPASVRFLARCGSMLVGIEDAAFTLSIPNGEWSRFSFAGASEAPVVRGERRLPETRNYFVGNDPRGWATDVPTWEGVRIDDLYPGIDLVFRSGGKGLEYDFVIAPGASPERIAMTSEGTMRLEKDGDALLASTSGGVGFRHLAPFSFQTSSRSHGIASAYRLRGNEVRFALGEYDRTAPLIIDPVIVASTYLGGASIDKANAVTLDAAGNIYIAGETYSKDYPFVNGVQSSNKSAPTERDAFITKLDPSGRHVIFSTYFGGARGLDIAQAIAVDRAGAVYIGGTTYSTDLPVSANAFQKEANTWVGTDGFLVKFSPAGDSIAYCTYLAANSEVPSTENINALAVDDAGNVVLAGDTTDPTWPITAGAYRTSGCGGYNDAFVTKVNASGSGLIYSTYICGSGNDMANAIRLDAAGSAYVAGFTTSKDFPQVGVPSVALHGPNDAWVAKLNATGSALIRSTLLGGRDQDIATSIALDGSGNIYIAGETSSSDFPTRNGYQSSYMGSPQACFDNLCGDAFVARLGPAFELLSATFLGGTNQDQIGGIAVSPAGVVVVGTTVSTNFPLVNPLQSKFGGTRDAFVATFDPTLRNLDFSTFIGGSDWDIGLGVTVDAAGAIYAVGYTGSTNLPTVNAYQPALAGAFDAFLIKLSAPPPPPSRHRAARP